jgi:hypothetical protein
MRRDGDTRQCQRPTRLPVPRVRRHAADGPAAMTHAETGARDRNWHCLSTILDCNGISFLS